jgi:hypothetical protein
MRGAHTETKNETILDRRGARTHTKAKTRFPRLVQTHGPVRPGLPILRGGARQQIILGRVPPPGEEQQTNTAPEILHECVILFQVRNVVV